MAAFGFSINTLTLCGLVLAIGLVVDDAIIVVENVEKFLERGYQPLRSRPRGHGRDHRADRHDHAGAGRGLRAGGVHPRPDRPALQPVRHDDRLLVRFLGGQLADVQPGDGPAVPQRPKHGESRFFFFRWFNRGMRWLENSYDAFLEFTAHHWWTIVVPSLGAAGPDGLDADRAAQGVHPDRGPGLPDRRDPDARRHQPQEPTSRVIGACRADRAQDSKASADTVLLDGFNVAQLDQPDQQRRRRSSSSKSGRATQGARAAGQGPGRAGSRQTLRRRGSATPWCWCSSRRRSGA